MAGFATKRTAPTHAHAPLRGPSPLPAALGSRTPRGREKREHARAHSPKIEGTCNGSKGGARWLWLKKPVPKWNPGKWKHGPTPAVCPSCLILSHVLVEHVELLKVKKVAFLKEDLSSLGSFLFLGGKNYRRLRTLVGFQRAHRQSQD